MVKYYTPHTFSMQSSPTTDSILFCDVNKRHYIYRPFHALSVCMMSQCVDVMMSHVLYTANLSSGKTFANFVILRSIANIFPRVLLNKLFYQDVMTWR